jgi:hypothetical protein
MRRGVPAPLLVAGEAPRSRGPMRRGFDMTGAKSGRGPHPMPLRDGPHGDRWAESALARLDAKFAARYPDIDVRSGEYAHIALIDGSGEGMTPAKHG